MMAAALNFDALIELLLKQGCHYHLICPLKPSCTMWGFLPHPQLLKCIGLLVYNMNGNCKCFWIILVSAREYQKIFASNEYAEIVVNASRTKKKNP